MKNLDPEFVIDGIRNTLLEGYDQTLDYTGPNWEYIARKVYEDHLHLAIEVVKAAKIARMSSGFREGNPNMYGVLCEALNAFDAQS